MVKIKQYCTSDIYKQIVLILSCLSDSAQGMERFIIFSNTGSIRQNAIATNYVSLYDLRAIH